MIVLFSFLLVPIQRSLGLGETSLSLLLGASLAIALQASNLRVALVESVAPDAAAQPSFDDRTTALGNGTRKIFEALDLWRELAPTAAPITHIHVSEQHMWKYVCEFSYRYNMRKQPEEMFNRMILASKT